MWPGNWSLLPGKDVVAEEPGNFSWWNMARSPRAENACWEGPDWLEEWNALPRVRNHVARRRWEARGNMRSPEVNTDLPGGNRWICYRGKYVSSLSLDRGVGPGKGRAAMAMAKSALAAMADVVPSQTGQPDAICSTIATIRHSCGNNFFVSNLSLGHVFPPQLHQQLQTLAKTSTFSSSKSLSMLFLSRDGTAASSCKFFFLSLSRFVTSPVLSVFFLLSSPSVRSIRFVVSCAGK